jgi:thiamine-phosphate pyrophosphorylase
LKPGIPRGLYVITDRALCDRHGISASVSAALEGGAVIVQYRDKTGERSRREGEAGHLARLCREHGAVFIVNDDPELALDCGAAGVHLGRDDTSIEEARRLLGRDAVIGVSCYDSITLARKAAVAGCDYVAFGSAFPSPTKPGAPHAPMSLYREAVSEIPVPVVAIGGITPDNAPSLLQAGCHALAVISGVFGQTDLRAAARRYARLFTEGPQTYPLE